MISATIPIDWRPTADSFGYGYSSPVSNFPTVTDLAAATAYKAIQETSALSMTPTTSSNFELVKGSRAGIIAASADLSRFSMRNANDMATPNYTPNACGKPLLLDSSNKFAPATRHANGESTKNVAAATFNDPMIFSRSNPAESSTESRLTSSADCFLTEGPNIQLKSVETSLDRGMFRIGASSACSSPFASSTSTTCSRLSGPFALQGDHSKANPCNGCSSPGSDQFASVNCLMDEATGADRPMSGLRQLGQTAKTVSARAYPDSGRQRTFDTTRSTLLYEFRSNLLPNLTLADIRSHVAEFAKDQHGSRFIQLQLDHALPGDIEMIFFELRDTLYELSMDVFANYVVQKFLHVASDRMRHAVGEIVKMEVHRLSLHNFGCRVVQKVLEVLPRTNNYIIAQALKGHVIELIRDQKGNHVIQKALECVDRDKMSFVCHALVGQIVDVSVHMYGCRVVQRMLENLNDVQMRPLLDELLEHTDDLVRNEYGNYVIQHVLERGHPDMKNFIMAQLRGKAFAYSQDKFASNVIEKCVSNASRAQRNLFIEEVLASTSCPGGNPLLALMKDPYGNYVVQKIVDLAEPQQRKVLLSHIRPYMASLRKVHFGKHILTKVEKYIMASNCKQGQQTLLPSQQMVMRRRPATEPASLCCIGGGCNAWLNNNTPLPARNIGCCMEHCPSPLVNGRTNYYSHTHHHVYPQFNGYRQHWAPTEHVVRCASVMASAPPRMAIPQRTAVLPQQSMLSEPVLSNGDSMRRVWVNRPQHFDIRG